MSSSTQTLVPNPPPQDPIFQTTQKEETLKRLQESRSGENHVKDFRIKMLEIDEIDESLCEKIMVKFDEWYKNGVNSFHSTYNRSNYERRKARMGGRPWDSESTRAAIKRYREKNKEVLKERAKVKRDEKNKLKQEEKALLKEEKEKQKALEKEQKAREKLLQKERIKKEKAEARALLKAAKKNKK